ncbi:hydroxysteroid 11-beta-dehydrogenase 1-like protein isoform X1 [Callithrix jacchus]
MLVSVKSWPITTHAWAPTWCSLPTPRPSCRRRAGLPRAQPHWRRPGRHAGAQRPGNALAHAGAPPLRGSISGTGAPAPSLQAPLPSRPGLCLLPGRPSALPAPDTTLQTQGPALPSGIIGQLSELRATDVPGIAQPDGQQGLSGGGVLAARPRARVVLHPVLGGQVRAGRLLRLPAAGAGRAGRERGHHHVRPGPPRSRLRRRGSQGSHEGQGGPGAQGGPGRDPRRRHARGRRLLPVAFPPAVLAPALAAAPAGLVHPPGTQRHGRGCSLSTEGYPSTSRTGTLLPPTVPGARTLTRDTPERVATAQDKVVKTEKQNPEKRRAPGTKHSFGGAGALC